MTYQMSTNTWYGVPHSADATTINRSCRNKATHDTILIYLVQHVL